MLRKPCLCLATSDQAVDNALSACVQMPLLLRRGNIKLLDDYFVRFVSHQVSNWSSFICWVTARSLVKSLLTANPHSVVVPAGRCFLERYCPKSYQKSEWNWQQLATGVRSAGDQNFAHCVSPLALLGWEGVFTFRARIWLLTTFGRCKLQLHHALSTCVMWEGVLEKVFRFRLYSDFRLINTDNRT